MSYVIYSELKPSEVDDLLRDIHIDCACVKLSDLLLEGNYIALGSKDYTFVSFRHIHSSTRTTYLFTTGFCTSDAYKLCTIILFDGRWTYTHWRLSIDMRFMQWLNRFVLCWSSSSSYIIFIFRTPLILGYMCTCRPIESIFLNFFLDFVL